MAKKSKKTGPPAKNYNVSLFIPEVDLDLIEEVRDAVEFLKYTASAKAKTPDEVGRLRGINRSRLMRDAIEVHIAALRKKYNGGKRFPRRATDHLEPGRPPTS